jgi:tetratricopeptide (TPR) repeat protein
LLINLIAKSGMVWADVSELNNNVFYEIGAAHALRKLAMIVVREQVATLTPANIGHDAVMKYSDTASDWPDGSIAVMAGLLTELHTTSERWQRPRVSSEGVEAALEARREELSRSLTPAEAVSARELGARLLAAGEYALAETAFDEAFHLGLDDAPTLLGRGSSRLALGRLAEAEKDFGEALALTAHDDTMLHERALAARFRGIARDEQGNLEGAISDYTLAIELGPADAELFVRRGSARLELGRRAEATADANHARTLSPNDEALLDLDAALSDDCV